MKFSLINVFRESRGFVDGTWLQDCNGVTLEEATERARATEKANSNRIKVAVVEQLIYVPNYSNKTGLKRLD